MLIQFFVAAVAVVVDFVAVEFCHENCERCGYHPIPYSTGFSTWGTRAPGGTQKVPGGTAIF